MGDRDRGDNNWLSDIGVKSNKRKKGNLTMQAAEDKPDETQEKQEKNMKGLVYQGGENVDQNQSPAAMMQQPNLEKPIEQKPAVETSIEGQPDTEKTDVGLARPEDFIEFADKGSGKVRIILIILIVIAIVGIVAYILLTSHGGKNTTTTSLKGTTTAGASSSGSSTVFSNLNKTVINNLNVLYLYTGPASSGNRTCGKTTNSTVVQFTRTLNASQQFPINFYTSSGNCAFTISNVSITTQGFQVVSAVPPLPQTIPPQSSIYILLTVRAPQANFTGPVSFIVKEQ